MNARTGRGTVEGFGISETNILFCFFFNFLKGHLIFRTDGPDSPDGGPAGENPRPPGTKQGGLTGRSVSFLLHRDPI